MHITEQIYILSEKPQIPYRKYTLLFKYISISTYIYIL